jgi:hypothetical protein
MGFMAPFFFRWLLKELNSLSIPPVTALPPLTFASSGLGNARASGLPDSIQGGDDLLALA